jgi:O-acetyl-ADP-ribose deacetylase (regulator of RNase III)
MIEYVIGDATDPQGEDNKIIAHIVNDEGKWGAGFVLAVSEKFPRAEKNYRKWYAMSTMSIFDCVPFRLGRMKLVSFGNVAIANMIAQEGVGWKDGVPPIRYNALEDCLAELALHAKVAKASVHMPRIGCGLSGSTWDKIEPLIAKHLHDVRVVVYDLPEAK